MYITMCTGFWVENHADHTGGATAGCGLILGAALPPRTQMLQSARRVSIMKKETDVFRLGLCRWTRFLGRTVSRDGKGLRRSCGVGVTLPNSSLTKQTLHRRGHTQHTWFKSHFFEICPTILSARISIPFRRRACPLKSVKAQPCMLRRMLCGMCRLKSCSNWPRLGNQSGKGSCDFVLISSGA